MRGEDGSGNGTEIRENYYMSTIWEWRLLLQKQTFLLEPTSVTPSRDQTTYLEPGAAYMQEPVLELEQNLMTKSKFD